jgi:hypothetical protein
MIARKPFEQTSAENDALMSYGGQHLLPEG